MEHDPLVVSLKQKAKPGILDSVPRKQRRLWPYAALLIAILACGAMGYYGYLYAYKAFPDADRAASGDAAAEVADTIARVSELIVLPEGEEPTIATVIDPEKLKEQAFFKDAKAGYRVLLYTKAKKAYLYDPSAHRLIEVAPITTELQ